MIDKLKKDPYLLVVMVIALALSWSVFVPGIFSTHDNINILRIEGMTECLKDLQIPCRVAPNLGLGYGTPVFNYLAPLPFYIGGVVNLLLQNSALALRVLFLIPILGAAFYMYRLGELIWKNTNAGLLSAVFYISAPFMAMTLFVRGSLGEGWMMMLVPACLYYILKLAEKTSVKNSLILSIFIALLLLSHLFSLVVFILLGVFSLLLLLQKKDLRFLKFIGVSFFIGILIPCFYLVPAILETDLVHFETIMSGSNTYPEQFKGLKKLLIDRSWGYGVPTREIPGLQQDQLSYQVGLLPLLLALITFVWVLIKNGRSKLIALFLLVSFFISLFLITSRSQFIWANLQPLHFLQFPWRFLSIVIFSLSLLAGGVVAFIRGNKMNFIPWLIILITLGLNIFYFKPVEFLDAPITQDQKIQWQKVYPHAMDYLPKHTYKNPLESPRQPYEVIFGESQITNFKQSSDLVKFNAKTDGFTIIRISKFYFDGWKIFVDGKEIEVNPNNELGLITFALDPGAHQVEIKLTNTVTRNLANGLSIFGLALLFVLSLTQFKKTRRWMLYYIKGVN